MSLLGILFGHAHKYTRVFTLGRGFKRRSYVVCTECGKEFDYSLAEMRIVKRVTKSPVYSEPTGRRAQVVEIGEFRRIARIK